MGENPRTTPTSSKIPPMQHFSIAKGKHYARLHPGHTEPFFCRYSEESAATIAEHVHSLCTPSTNIAFLCCPTAFVAFQHKKRLENAKLLEYDQRFAILSPKQFIPYDLDDPDVFPESLRGTVEIAVADPPFLNEVNSILNLSLPIKLIIFSKVTNKKLAQTLKQILHPTKGKLLLITSTSVEEIIQRIYDAPPLGPLRKTSIEVEHGQLANDFACWGSWEGAKDLGKTEEN